MFFLKTFQNPEEKKNMYSQVHPCFYMYVGMYIYIYIHISGEVGASVVHVKTRLGCTHEKATHLFTRMLMMMMMKMNV